MLSGIMDQGLEVVHAGEGISREVRCAVPAFVELRDKPLVLNDPPLDLNDRVTLRKALGGSRGEEFEAHRDVVRSTRRLVVLGLVVDVIAIRNGPGHLFKSCRRSP